MEKNWYSNGKIKTEALFDTVSQKLILREYYRNGVIKSEGELIHGNWKYEEDIYDQYGDSIGTFTTSLTGYLQTGIWKYYDQVGNLKNEKNIIIMTIENW